MRNSVVFVNIYMRIATVETFEVPWDKYEKFSRACIYIYENRDRRDFEVPRDKYENNIKTNLKDRISGYRLAPDFGQATLSNSCKHGTGTSISPKGGKFLDQLSDY